jgi:hypothetical protein
VNFAAVSIARPRPHRARRSALCRSSCLRPPSPFSVPLPLCSLHLRAHLIPPLSPCQELAWRSPATGQRRAVAAHVLLYVDAGATQARPRRPGKPPRDHAVLPPLLRRPRAPGECPVLISVKRHRFLVVVDHVPDRKPVRLGVAHWICIQRMHASLELAVSTVCWAPPGPF